MKTFKEFLNEGKEEAKIIRDALKKELGLSSRDVSVKNKSSGYSTAVDVTIKSMKALSVMSKIEDIGNVQRSVDRDEHNGEILSGGNTYIFTSIDYKFKTSLAEMIQKEFEKQLGSGELNDDSPAIILYNTFSVNSSRGEKYVSLKGGGKTSDIMDDMYVGGAVLFLIEQLKDDSLYSKIK